MRLSHSKRSNKLYEIFYFTIEGIMYAAVMERVTYHYGYPNFR